MKLTEIEQNLLYQEETASADTPIELGKPVLGLPISKVEITLSDERVIRLRKLNGKAKKRYKIKVKKELDMNNIIVSKPEKELTQFEILKREWNEGK